MRTEEAVDRLLQGLERLEGRLDKIEGKLQHLESAPPPREPEPDRKDRPPPEERPDPFQPAIVRAPASRHLQAVTRALSMLGLVPEGPEEEEQRNSAKYKAAMQRSLEALRGAGAEEGAPGKEEAEAPAAEAPPVPETAPAPEPPALQIAREAALPEAAPPAATGMFRGALRRAKAAAARLGGKAPAEEPAVAAPEAGAAPAARPPVPVAPSPASSAGVIPPPEVAAAVWAEAVPEKPETRAVDLGTALQIDLERPVTHARDYAAPILNALVLLAAAGGALYAGGAITTSGPARDAWPEIATGLAAVACGAAAWFWRSASTHVRAFLAGVAALLLNVVLLVILPRLEFPDVLSATACGLVAFLGLRLVLETRHPLALFVGFGLALLLPHWFAPMDELRMPFVAAINVATAFGALRLHRLQASVASAVLAAPLLYGSHGPLAVMGGATSAATFITAALFAPIVLKRRSLSAAALAVAGFAYAAWTVHIPYDGPGWLKASVLFAVAAAASLVAVRLPARHELLKGVFKAGALLLLLAALPAGLEAQSLAPSTLFLALLFAVFALALRDAFLRAAGSLMLVATIGLFHREGAAAPLLFAASAVATTLCAASPVGPSPRLLVLLLGGAAHGLFLVALSRVVPAPWLGYAWLGTALALQGAARRFPLRFLEAGGAIAAAAAAFRGFVAPDPIALGSAGAAFVALAVLARRPLFLLAAELLAITAVAVAWPGPQGLLFTLPLLALLLLPWPVARAHGRMVALVLLARCLAPDVLFASGETKTAAMAVCIVAGVFAARAGRAVRIPALLLATAVAGAWVYARTRREDWSIWAASVTLAAGFVAALPRSRKQPVAGEQPAEAEAAAAPAAPPRLD